MVKKLMAHESPVINGDGEYSRDFTYIDNVLHMNMLALNTTNTQAVNQIYNTAGGGRTSINKLANEIKSCLVQYDFSISDINPIYGANRLGDIPHSFASIDKAKQLLGYSPLVSFQEGLNETVKWYVNNKNH